MFDLARWHLQGRIIIAEFSGEAVRHDIKRSAELIRKMISSDGELPVSHVIADVTAVTEIDVSILKLHPVKDAIAPLTSHTQLGWFIMVDPKPNYVILFIAETIAELTTRRFRVVDSLDAALRFIDDIDPTIALPFTVIKD